MKIGQQPDLTPAAAQITQPAAAKPGAAAPGGARADRRAPGVDLTVSDLARTLEQTRAADSNAIDMEKVNAMRLAIEKGTYAVNAEAIADKLLANAQEMLNRTLS